MRLQPENLMFDSEGAGGILKVLDFGSSVHVQSDEEVGLILNWVMCLNCVCDHLTYGELWECGMRCINSCFGGCGLYTSNITVPFEFST